MNLIIDVNVPGFNQQSNEDLAALLVIALSERGGGVFRDEFEAKGSCVYARTIRDTLLLGTFAEGFIAGMFIVGAACTEIHP